MQKGFYSTILLLILLCVVVVSSMTYYKIQTVQKRIHEGLTGQSSGGYYDTHYMGGLGWGKGFGDWRGKETTIVEVETTDENGNTVIQKKDWTPPGWSVLWKGQEMGGTGDDQVFHETSLEGEMGNNYDPPPAEDTINRLGGGWDLEMALDTVTENGNSIIPPSGEPDDSYGKINGDLTFYAPGTFMYGADNYVPSYSSSVLLSPMLGVNAPLRPVKGEGQGGGKSYEPRNSVCSPDSGATVIDKESYCQRLSAKEASNALCCIALGGTHAMGGNEQGPYNRTVYTNPMITGPKDFYIHLGKCYGNCPTTYGEIA